MGTNESAEQPELTEDTQLLVPEKCRPCYDLARALMLCGRFPILPSPKSLIEDVENKCSGYEGAATTEIAAPPTIAANGMIKLSGSDRTSLTDNCPYFRNEE